MVLLTLLFSLFVLGILIYIIYILAYSLIFGAPYAALGKERTKRMFELLNIKKGERTLDLGSGDGRLVVKAASFGAKAYGFEINPVLVLISKLKTKDIQNVTIQRKDMWRTDFSRFDAVTVYGNFHIMKRLEKKLLKELKPGARVVSNHFTFPNWKPAKELSDVYLYIKRK